METTHVHCAGGVVFDADGRLLLIQRGTAPAAGSWSVPGGRCLPDEDAAAACIREVLEETGLVVAIERLAGRVERPGSAPGVVFDIDDYVCTVVGGELASGTDAIDARWVSRAQLGDLELVPGLIDALTGWGLLPD